MTITDTSELPGLLDPLTLSLADWLAARDPEHGEALRAAAIMLAVALRDGHTAIRLRDIESGETFAELREAGIALPSSESLRTSLAASRLVGAPGDATPLILEGDLLAFRRFHAGEREISEAVRSRLYSMDEEVDAERLKPLFERLFSGDAKDSVEGEVNWQAVAAVAALRSRFLCIAGGPGTGKTTTVIRLMALLLENEPELRIRLAAPTGKAANRMAESISTQRDRLDVDEALKARIPTTAATLHRLLGYRPSRATFRFGKRQKLTADVVIVDEASMIDLELFTALLNALDDDTTLILLGDPDQLPSVDAGFVFGDLCRMDEGEAVSGRFAALLHAFGLTHLPPVDHTADPMRDAVVTLRKGYRFGPESGIGHLAYALRDGESEKVADILTSGGYDDLAIVPRDEQKRTLRRAVRDLAKALTKAASPNEALAALDRMRVLSPLRVGPQGVDALNEDLDLWLVDEKIREWGSEYRGKPILITTNDYEVSLFNGDVGVLWTKDDGRFVGCFPVGDGVREVPLNRLPPHEVAWAMTVHKSQGSEFDDVILVLPEKENAERLTRELVYTAVTRARKRVTIVGEIDVIAEAAMRREERITSLASFTR